MGGGIIAIFAIDFWEKMNGEMAKKSMAKMAKNRWRKWREKKIAIFAMAKIEKNKINGEWR